MQQKLDSGQMTDHGIQLEAKPNADEPLFFKRWNVICFFEIIDNCLNDFFDIDQCFMLADNYLIAMVFAYFLRAALKPSEYTPFNFFVALYLAHVMEEDDDANYENIQLWAIAKANGPHESSVFKTQDTFFQRMNYRCVVSRHCCELIMKAAQPDHKVWQRKRHENHSGVISEYYRKTNTCPACCAVTVDKMNGTRAKSRLAKSENSHSKRRHKLSRQ